MVKYLKAVTGNMQDWMLDALESTSGNSQVAKESSRRIDTERFHLFIPDDIKKGQVQNFIRRVDESSQKRGR